MKDYWDIAALDPEVDKKYICDVDTALCLQDLGELKGKVLEIGCGVGRLMKDGYCGIDISTKMLEIANQRKPQCRFIHNMNGYIPVENNSFDTVYCYLVMQHLKPEIVQKYFTETYRVLKDGGLFIFQFIQGTEREPLSNHYTIDEMSKMIELAGFEHGGHYRKSYAHELWTIARVTK